MNLDVHHTFVAFIYFLGIISFLNQVFNCFNGNKYFFLMISTENFDLNQRFETNLFNVQ